MSHTVSIQCALTNVPALKAAVAAIKGLEFREGQHKFKTYGESRKCDHAIGLTAKSGMQFEVGVVQKAKAGQEYELQFDSFDSALAQVVGYNCEHILQGYQKQVALEHLPFGWNWTEVRQPNGDLVMEMSH